MFFMVLLQLLVIVVSKLNPSRVVHLRKINWKINLKTYLQSNN